MLEKNWVKKFMSRVASPHPLRWGMGHYNICLASCVTTHTIPQNKIFLIDTNKFQCKYHLWYFN